MDQKETDVFKTPDTNINHQEAMASIEVPKSTQLNQITRLETSVTESLGLTPGSPEAVAATDEALVAVATGELAADHYEEAQAAFEATALESALEATGLKHSTGENPIIELERDGYGAQLTSAVEGLHVAGVMVSGERSAAEVVATEIDRVSAINIETPGELSYVDSSEALTGVEAERAATLEHNSEQIAEWLDASDRVFGLDTAYRNLVEHGGASLPPLEASVATRLVEAASQELANQGDFFTIARAYPEAASSEILAARFAHPESIQSLMKNQELAASGLLDSLSQGIVGGDSRSFVEKYDAIESDGARASVDRHLANLLDESATEASKRVSYAVLRVKGGLEGGVTKIEAYNFTAADAVGTLSDTLVDGVPLTDMSELQAEAALASTLEASFEASKNQVQQAAASERNARYVESGNLLDIGDLVHTSNIISLAVILSQGLVAGELTGEGATVDAFPYNVDLNTAESVEDSFAQTVDAATASRHGSQKADAVTFVLSREHTFTTRNATIVGEPDYANKHQLAFGAIPSTEIASIIVAGEGASEASETVIDRVCQGDVYYPVVSETGNVLLTPTDYQKRKNARPSAAPAMHHLGPPRASQPQRLSLVGSSMPDLGFAF